MKNLTKEEQEIVERFETEFPTKSGMIHIMADDMLSFLLSEIRTAVERERERIREEVRKLEPDKKEWQGDDSELIAYQRALIDVLDSLK